MEALRKLRYLGAATCCQPGTSDPSRCRASRTGEVDDQLHHVLLELGALELEHRRSRVRLAVGGVRDDAESGQLEGEQLVLEPCELGRDQRVLAAGRPPTPSPARAAASSRRPERPRRARCPGGTSRSPSRGSPRRRGSRPARDVVEEDLVDLVAAVDHLDGPHGDARRRHVDEQERDARLLLRRVGVGADQGEDPVAVLAERRPGLLAVDDVLVAVRGSQSCAARRGPSRHRARRSPATTRCRGSRWPGRKRSLISCEPKFAITGPTMPALNAERRRYARRAASPRARCGAAGGSSPRPPHSTGQFGTASPAAFMARIDRTSWSLVSSRRAATVSRMSWGICVVKNVRISSRKASSSADSRSLTSPNLPPRRLNKASTGWAEAPRQRLANRATPTRKASSP